MHRYQPRFHVICCEPTTTTTTNEHQSYHDHNHRRNFRTFILNETKFFAVTAYQNHRVTIDLLQQKN